MTTKADFTAEEWEQIIEGPPSAGMVVITAQRGGMLRETISLAQAYVEARKQHGHSELLDEVVAVKPKLDHTRYASLEELKEHSLAHVRDGVALVKAKASAEELDEYKQFIVNLADRVAHAHREHGSSPDAVSDAERAATAEIATALG
jgi:hypothetical protein